MVEVDGFVVATPSSDAATRVLTKLLIECTGSKLAQRASSVMSGEAKPAANRAPSAPSTFGGRAYPEAMEERELAVRGFQPKALPLHYLPSTS